METVIQKSAYNSAELLVPGRNINEALHELKPSASCMRAVGCAWLALCLPAQSGLFSETRRKKKKHLIFIWGDLIYFGFIHFPSKMVMWKQKFLWCSHCSSHDASTLKELKCSTAHDSLGGKTAALPYHLTLQWTHFLPFHCAIFLLSTGGQRTEVQNRLNDRMCVCVWYVICICRVVFLC